jgi:pyruvate dehydrogenase E1 component beta subunit
MSKEQLLMATEILMPALSPTMEEGKLARWLVKEGEEINAGDVIAEIETDKATMEVEAIDDGLVARLLVAEGSEGVKVNTPIALVMEEGEELDDTTSTLGKEPEQKALEPENAKSVEIKEITPTPTIPISTPAIQIHVGENDISEDTAMVELTMREALRDAMAEEMRRDEDVFVMGEEVAEYQGAYKVTQGLLAEFGSRRVIDTPITEHGFAGIAVGAAFAGLKPVVEFMTWNFAMQAIDHILNSAAKTLYMSGGQMSSSIVFRGPNGAASRVGAQHSQDYSSWYAQVPGLKVIAPYTATDAKGLLKAAIRDPNPVVFLEHEMVYGQSFEIPDVDDLIIPIGKAAVVRPGNDITVVSFSRGMQLANEAATVLAEQGISAEVIDLRTLRPLDMETILTSVRKTNRIVTVEESWPVASIGSEICSRVAFEAFDYLDAPPTKVSGKDVPMPYAANLEKLALPSVDDVVSAVKSVCYRDMT